MYKSFSVFIILFLACITAQAMYDEEDINEPWKNNIGYYNHHKYMYEEEKQKEIEEQWKNKIGYKDHDKYMHELGGTEAQKEYSKERNFVIAAENGDLEKCRSFLNEGVDINANNNRGTALGGAARDNRMETCEFLISRGANIDLFTVAGETPLMLAAEAGNIEICELLIQNGANVNMRRPGTDQTLRYYAQNNLKIIDLLEKHGLTKLERLEDKKEEVTSVDQESSQQKLFDNRILSWCTLL